MLSVNISHLEFASLILRSRLTRPLTIDVNILSPAIVNPQCDFFNLFGRLIGCFGLRSDTDVCFYLAMRYDPESKYIRCIYVFYMNHNYDRIQQSEVDVLKQYIPYIDEGEDRIKVGIINIKSSAHPSTHLSVLIEVIDHFIGQDLINFEKVRYIDTDTRNLAIGPTRNCNLQHCDGFPSQENIERFEDAAKYHDLSFGYRDSECKRSQVDVIMFRTNGHLIDIIVNKDNGCVNHLLLHRNQYLDENHYASVKNLINEWSEDNSLAHCCTRILPERFIRCDSDEALTALKLALTFRPHVLSIIRNNELQFLMGNDADHLSRGWLREEVGSFRFYKPATGSDSDNRAIGSQTRLRLNKNGRFEDVDDYLDSQRTIIVAANVWKNDLEILNDVSRERRRIKDSIVPPVHNMFPHSDYTQSYIKHFPTYKEALELIVEIWNRYAPTALFFDPTIAEDRRIRHRAGKRFLVYALQNINEGEDFLLVADQVERRWIMMSASNREARDRLHYEVSECSIRQFNELKGFTGEAILITSSFHAQYTKLHLVMSLYVISRLFKYSVELPKKVIYGEWELRKYAHNICAELQLVNAQYNIDNNLVDECGFLKEGAKESLPSPLAYEVSVVPKDQCMFCKKRYFNNLGKHLSMKHGQKAQYANRKRLESNMAVNIESESD